MTKTHKEIVEDIKAEVPPNVREYVDKIALAAARGAAGAARVETEDRIFTEAKWPFETQAEVDGWNAAIAQSQRQIEEHFRGGELNPS